MSNVQLRTLGRTGLRVSNACLGTMTFGTPGWGCGEDTAAEIVNAFSDAGGNFFDTADIYAGGESERILGRALRGRRDQCVVATKVGNTSLPGPNGRGLSRKHIHEAVKASLKRLQTDYIDLYQVHYSTPDAGDDSLTRPQFSSVTSGAPTSSPGSSRRRM